MSEDTIEIGLRFYLTSFTVRNSLTNEKLTEDIHQGLVDYFSNFEVVIERVERDGEGRLISCSVGLVKN